MIESNRQWMVRLIATAALASSIGCGSDGESSPRSLSSLGIDDGASAGQTASALLTAESETVLKLDTGARLTVPEGSVTKQLKVDLTRPPDSDALPLLKTVQSEYKVASAPYVVTPHGSTFEKDLELSLPIAKGNPDRLVVAFLEDENDKTWEIHGKPRVTGNAAKVPVRHFSVYVLLEQTDEPELDAGADVEPDAGGPLTGTLQERVAKRLAQCGLVAQAGKYEEDFGDIDAEDECEIACMFRAPCSDFALEWCEDATDTPSTEVDACFEACRPYPSVECETEYDGVQFARSCDGYAECLDGSDEDSCPASAFLSCDGFGNERVPVSEKCDGYEACSDGSDENGCPSGLHFVCESGGGRIPAADACDGYEDCNDGSDEANCELFTCSDGAQQIPSRLLCNLSRDCSDGSDEDQGCLKLTCEPYMDETATATATQSLSSKRRRR